MIASQANRSAESLLAKLEADATLTRAIIEEALEANTMDRVQALLWQFVVKIQSEIETAQQLWPLEKWGTDSQRACKWIHSASLALQMVYRQDQREPAAA